MATYITPSVIASAALPTLFNTTVLLPLVNRDYQDEFNGKQGDTITVRTPASFAVKVFDRIAGIILQDPTEGSFTVKLDKLLDISFPVTTEDLTLRLESFETQLLNPAMEAFSQDMDARLAEQLVDAAESNSPAQIATGTGNTAGDRHKAFRRARAILSRNRLPLTQRYYVLSPEGVEAVTGDQVVLQANTSASTEALREGSVGRLSGFDGYESQVFGFGPEDRGEADGVAFHRSAVAAVTRTLEKPEELAASAVAIKNYKGIGLRVVKAYDINKKQTVVSIDTLLGVSTIRKNAAVELDFGQGS